MKRTSPLAAIARGKVSVGEDLLTGVILGRLGQLDGGLARLLNGALQFESAGSVGERPRVVEVLELNFWPWWDHHPRLNGCEPDAELVALDDRGHRLLFAVEAKLGSEKSGDTLEDDQLMRQVASGPARAAELGAEFAGVVFLTAHSVLPTTDLVNSAQRCAKQRLHQAALYWTNWSACHAALRACGADSDPLDADITELLTRLAQEAFAGLSMPSVAPRWGFTDRVVLPEAPPAWSFGSVTWRPLKPPSWSFQNAD